MYIQPEEVALAYMLYAYTGGNDDMERMLDGSRDQDFYTFVHIFGVSDCLASRSPPCVTTTCASLERMTLEAAGVVGHMWNKCALYEPVCHHLPRVYKNVEKAWNRLLGSPVVSESKVFDDDHPEL
jgi:hypothetical protein